mmetsp:Transcript_25142/g.32803  ORF Transcript_25142/g.32803 Transcript_25142/m.32803 type:complete len:356 (-) Transcript_25142:168-1235(-)
MGLYASLIWYGKQVILWGAGIIAIVCTVLWYYQDSLLYYPSMPGLPKRPQENPEGFRSPADYGIEYEDMYATTSDGITVHGWLMKQQKDPQSKPTIIFFHGNAGNIGFRLMNASQMYHKLGCNVLLVDYRGYGNSEGSPTEEGLKLDAIASLQFLIDHPVITVEAGLFAFGRSLGGAVAVALASQFPIQVRAVIVENTFLSISNMVDEVMPSFISLFKPLVLRIKWSNEDLMPQIQQPILFLAGGQDELVPPSHMKRLYDLAQKARFKERHVVTFGTHNDTWHKGGAPYYLAMKKFIQRVCEEKMEKSNISIAEAIPADLCEGDQTPTGNLNVEQSNSIPIMPNLFGKEKRHKFD